VTTKTTPAQARTARTNARIGAGMAMALGVCLLSFGVYTFVRAEPTPAPFSLALVLGGALGVVLGWLSLRGNRPAWAFALSLNGTAFVMFLFGVARVRDGTGLHLALAMVPALAYGFTTLMMALGSDEYEPRAARRAGAAGAGAGAQGAAK
jgi:hypothetical protein